MIFFNGQVWYISAMLICMLLLCYVLIKNRDFFIYVFSPLFSVLSFGYMFYCHQDGNLLPEHINFCGFCLWGIIRAACGLCFGVTTWLIYEKLIVLPENKAIKIAVTITELFLNIIFFYVWFFKGETKETLFSVMLLLPIIVAIAFSGKSYIARIFRFKWMKYFGPLSLTIYLNHNAAVLMATALFADKPYYIGLAAIAVLTVVFGIVNFVAVKIIRKLWEKFKRLAYVN